MYQNHIKHLEKQHQELDKKIDTMEKTGKFGDTELHALKKQRLHIKDEIAKIKAEHKDD